MLIGKTSKRFKSCVALSVTVLLVVSMFTTSLAAVTIGQIADTREQGTVTVTVNGAEQNEEVTLLVYPSGATPTKDNIAHINQDTQTDTTGIKTFTFKLPEKSTAGTYVVKAGSTNTTQAAETTMNVLTATQPVNGYTPLAEKNVAWGTTPLAGLNLPTEVEVTYGTESVANIAVNAWTSEPAYNAQLAGTYVFTTSLNEASLTAANLTDSASPQIITQTVIVGQRPAAVAQSIAVTTSPKTAYYVGEALDLTNGIITVTYDYGDATTAALSAAEVTGFDSQTPGTQTLNVSYLGLNTTYDVTVTAVEITGIAVTTSPKTAYYVGEALDVTGGEITVTYNNNTTSAPIAITSAMVSGFDSATAGTKTLTVTYEGETATYEIVVSNASVTGIAMLATPKQAYFVGDALDVTGGTITVSYDYGAPITIDITEAMVSNFDSSVAGTYNLTVTYEGKTTTYEIVVSYVASTVSIGAITNVDKTTAKLSASFEANSDEVSMLGFAYNTVDSFETAFLIPTGTEYLTYDLTGLTADTTYYVWSYITVNETNKPSTSASFKTLALEASTVTPPSKPVVTTKDTATFDAAYDAKDYVVTEAGFVYGPASVTVAGEGTTKLVAAPGTPFTAVATELTVNTNYKVWSYIVVGGATTYSTTYADFATLDYSNDELAAQFIDLVDAIGTSTNDVTGDKKAAVSSALAFYTQHEAKIATLVVEKHALLTAMNSKITFLEETVTLSVNGKTENALVVINPRGGNIVEFALDATTAAKAGYTFNFDFYAADAEPPVIGEYVHYAAFSMPEDSIVAGQYFARANISSVDGFTKSVVLAFAIANEDVGSITITGENGKDLDSKFPKFVYYRGVTISLDKTNAPDGETYAINYKSVNDSDLTPPDAGEFETLKSKSFEFGSAELGTYYAVVYVKSANGDINTLTKKYFVIVNSLTDLSIDINGLDFAATGRFPRIPNHRQVKVTVSNRVTETLTYNYALRAYGQAIGVPSGEWTSSTTANLNPDGNLADGTYYVVVFTRNSDTEKEAVGEYDSYFVKKYVVIRSSAIAGSVEVDGIDSSTGNFPRIARDGELNVSLSLYSDEAANIEGSAKYYYTLVRYGAADPVPSANDADWTTETTGVSLTDKLNAIADADLGTYRIVAFVRNADTKKTGTDYDTVLYRNYIYVQKTSVYVNVGVQGVDYSVTNTPVLPKHRGITAELTLGATSTNKTDVEYSYHIVPYAIEDTTAVGWEWTTETSKFIETKELASGTYKLVVYVRNAGSAKIGDNYDGKFTRRYVILKTTDLVGTVSVNGQTGGGKYEPVVSKQVDPIVEIGLDLVNPSDDIQYKFAVVRYLDSAIKKESDWLDTATGTIDVTTLDRGTYIAYVYIKYDDSTAEYDGIFAKKYFLIRD